MVASYRIVVAATLLAIGFGGGTAPTVAQDRQVPVDQDSTVYSLTPDLREALGLFPEVSGYQGAELYRGEEDFELVIRFEQNGQVRRERRSLSVADVRELRREVTKALGTVGEQRSFTQEGRYGLIAATTFHGLVEGGLIVGAIGEEEGNAGSIVLASGAAGFFFPLLATRRVRVTEGEADMTFYGGAQGYAHAAQTASLLLGSDADGRFTAGLAAVFGAVEGTAGYLVARRNNWSGGHAEMVSFTGLGGNLIGLGLGAALVEDPGQTEEFGQENRILSGMSMVGSLAGIYLGHRMGRTGRYTEGDARVYLQGALQGVNLMGSFLALGEVQTRATALLLTGSGTAGGLLGRWMVQDRDFTGTEGNLIALGSVAGSLLGLAFTAGDSTEDSAVIAQSLGAATGFGITYAVLEGEAQRRTSSSTSSFDLDVNVGPGVARVPASGSVGSGGATRIAPRLTLSASF